MEQSVESNFFKKFKAIASLAHTSPIFQIFLFKKRFIRKSSTPGHGNLVLITSTVQVELSQLNFNFDDDIRTYLFQVLRDCWQITFVTLDGFYPLRTCSLEGKFLNILWHFIHLLQYYPKLNNGQHTKSSNLYVC